MRTEDIKKVISVCLDQKKYCAVTFNYDANRRHFYPLFMSDTLFLGAEEYDFELDGYSIRRIEDITNIQFEKEMLEKILMARALLILFRFQTLMLQTGKPVCDHYKNWAVILSYGKKAL